MTDYDKLVSEIAPICGRCHGDPEGFMLGCMRCHGDGYKRPSKEQIVSLLISVAEPLEKELIELRKLKQVEYAKYLLEEISKFEKRVAVLEVERE